MVQATVKSSCRLIFGYRRVNPKQTAAAIKGQDPIEDTAEQNNNPQSCIPLK
jgi:hypothetical protein